MDWNAIISVGWKIIAVVVLVLLNGFFVAAEFALVKVRDTQLSPLIQTGNRRAKTAQYITERLDAFLSAAQLGITLASLGLGWIGEPVFSEILKPVFNWLSVDSLEIRHALSFALGFSTITFLHISAGEQAPKWLAIQKALPTSLWVAYPLLWFYRISYPLVVVLNWSSQWLLRRVGLEPAGEGEGSHSEEELRLLVGAQKQTGSLAFRRRLVLNALDLRQRTVRDVMRPRQEITVLDTDATIAECIDLAEKSRYSRFPLSEGGNPDRTLGVVHIKDLYATRLKARSAADLKPVMRKLIYVPETARLEKLLQVFLDRKLHLAIVVDEYGGTMGLVSLENILEELVGQIQDEFDQENPLLTRISDEVWEAAGTLPLHELEEMVGETLHEEGITTASGWVTERLGGFPKIGDTMSVGQFELRVEQMEGTRVAKLKLTKRPQSENASASEI
jgi:CBS domain containing-hemolysin-like protein